MASQRQIQVGGVPIGGGAPVAVQTMTKTETANIGPTMEQIRTVAEAGADIVRVAVPREQDAEALRTIVAGAGRALVFLGFISLIVAIINLFPFLPLDGGHVLWSAAEKLRGRRISLAAMYRFSSVGIVLMLFLVINGVGNDISRLTG